MLPPGSQTSNVAGWTCSRKPMVKSWCLESTTECFTSAPAFNNGFFAELLEPDDFFALKRPFHRCTVKKREKPVPSFWHCCNTPGYFPYRMGGLKATTKWVFIGHFYRSFYCCMMLFSRSDVWTANSAKLEQGNTLSNTDIVLVRW